ncbi:hypothetical protein K439DRAFT_1410237 [Ramaria rubella]|nr:hypothetical protein K439DRAFT_1410237 [Ramaria rubella]
MTSQPSSLEPSKVTGKLKQAQGTVYQAIGAATGGIEWTKDGEKIQQDGAKEVDEARGVAQREAVRDRLYGKAQSAWGMVTGDQDKQTEGNMRAEKAEWKSAIADGELPTVSAERMEGKLESALGMATGNQEKQREGNIKAEKAEWTKG